MASGQRKIILILIAVAAVSWLTAPFWGSLRGPAPPIFQAPVLFDAESAFKSTEEFVTRNPNRVLGSIEARQAMGYLHDSLKSLGYELESPTYFDAIVAGRRQVGSNVIAFKAGALPEILMVIAHYDIARTAVQGVMDDGSGIGVMLELARVFSSAPLRHSLMIVASDGEEWGMLGAADLVDNQLEGRAPGAVLSLDGVSIGKLSAFRLNAEGQRGGYAPAWLRRIAAGSAQMQGLPAESSSGFREDLHRAVALAFHDQGPFLNARIPAINLNSASVDEALAREAYHSPIDTIAYLDTASIGAYGAAAERILRSIDGLPAIPGMDRSFRWQDDAFVSGWAMAVLQYVSFLPFLAMLVFAWRRPKLQPSILAVLREAVFAVAWLTPFALTYSLILFCRLIRLLPRNTLTPGPLKDPILENPAWIVIAVIFGLALVVGIGLHFLARYLTRDWRRSPGDAKAILMTFLFIVVVLALLYNPYWAATYLALPALLWSAAGRGRSIGARVMGAVIIVLAGFVFCVTMILAARDLQLGWRVLWYAVLALSNGMLRWQGYFLAACAVVLGMRFLHLQLSNIPENTADSTAA